MQQVINFYHQSRKPEESRARKNHVIWFFVLSSVLVASLSLESSSQLTQFKVLMSTKKPSNYNNKKGTLGVENKFRNQFHVCS